jgi:hypothetical protein
MQPLKINKGILLVYLSLLFTGCSRKAELLEFNNTGKIIDASNAVIQKDTVWKDLFGGDTIDYYVSSMVRIKNAVLTIKPGVRISFEDSLSGIRVEGTGGLRAEGTSNKRIVFTSRINEYGSWVGLIFASNNPDNILSFANIECAGSKADEGYCDKPAGIGIAKNVGAKAVITDCSISRCGSKGYGLWIAGSGDVSLVFQRNYLDLSNPIALTADNMARIDSSNQFTYTSSFIEVYGSNEIKNTDTIQNTKQPFRIEGKVFVTKPFVISPGCTFEFANSGELITSNADGTSHTGTIKAIGIPSKLITFKGITPSVSWTGITITSNNESEFRYCSISKAGNVAGFANPTNAIGNFVVGTSGAGAKATIMYCTISNSGGWGIMKNTNSAVTTKIMIIVNLTITWIETNKFSQNALGDIGSY